MAPSLREQNQALKVALQDHAAHAFMLRVTLKEICIALAAERPNVYPVDPEVLLRPDLDEDPTESIPLHTVKALQFKSPCSRIAPILILEKKNILELCPLQVRGNLHIFYHRALDDFISKRDIHGPMFISLFGRPPSFQKHAVNVLVERDPGQLEYFGIYYIYGHKDRITDLEWKFGDPEAKADFISHELRHRTDMTFQQLWDFLLQHPPLISNVTLRCVGYDSQLCQGFLPLGRNGA